MPHTQASPLKTQWAKRVREMSDEEMVQLLTIVLAALSVIRIVLTRTQWSWVLHRVFGVAPDAADAAAPTDAGRRYNVLIALVEGAASTDTDGQPTAMLVEDGTPQNDTEVSLTVSLVLAMLLAPWNLLGFVQTDVQWSNPFEHDTNPGLAGVVLSKVASTMTSIDQMRRDSGAWRPMAFNRLVKEGSTCVELNWVAQQFNDPAAVDPLEVVKTADIDDLARVLGEDAGRLEALRRLLFPTFVDAAGNTDDVVAAVGRAGKTAELKGKFVTPTMVDLATGADNVLAAADRAGMTPTIKAKFVTPTMVDAAGPANATVAALRTAGKLADVTALVVPPPSPTMVDAAGSTDSVIAALRTAGKLGEMQARMTPRLPATMVDLAAGVETLILAARRAGVFDDLQAWFDAAIMPPEPPSLDEIVERARLNNLVASIVSCGKGRQVYERLALTLTTSGALPPLSMDDPVVLRPEPTRSTPPRSTPAKRKHGWIPVLLIAVIIACVVGMIGWPGIKRMIYGPPTQQTGQQDAPPAGDAGPTDPPPAADAGKVVNKGTTKSGDADPVEKKELPVKAAAPFKPRAIGDDADRRNADITAQLKAFVTPSVGKWEGRPLIDGLACAGDNISTTYTRDVELVGSRKDFLGFLAFAATTGKLDDKSWEYDRNFLVSWYMVRRAAVYGTGFPYTDLKDYSQNEVVAHRRVILSKVGLTFPSDIPSFSGTTLTAERYRALEKKFLQDTFDLETAYENRGK